MKRAKTALNSALETCHNSQRQAWCEPKSLRRAGKDRAAHQDAACGSAATLPNPTSAPLRRRPAASSCNSARRLRLRAPNSRNLATSSLRRLLSPDSDCAAESTCDDAVSGLGRAALHVGDVGGDHLRPLCGLLHVAGDFLRRRALLFHGSRDRRGNFRQLSDGARDLLDGADRFLGRRLDAGDLLADLARGLRGLFGQRLHLGSHDRETAAGLTGARRLDGRVEGKQIGLACDVVDQFDHVADAGWRLSTIHPPDRWSLRPDRRHRSPSAPIPAPAG